MRCIHEGCNKECKNISGLKKHLSMSHDGWTPEMIAPMIAEVEASVPINQPTPEERETLFSEDSIPAHETAQASGPDVPRERSTRPDAKQRKAAKELTEALGEVKDTVLQLLPIATVGLLETKMGIAGTLSEKAVAAVGRLWSAYFGLFGVELEVEDNPAKKVKVKGRWIKFFAPIAIIGYTYFLMTGKHKVETADEKKKKEKSASAPLLIPGKPVVDEVDTTQPVIE